MKKLIIPKKVNERLNNLQNRYHLRKKRLLEVPFLGLLHEIGSQFKQLRVTSMAAESAYYLLLAFFPFTIFLISLLGIVGRRISISERMLTEINGLIPEPVFILLNSFLQEILNSNNWTLLSFSMVGVIWASSNGFTVLLKGLDRAYDPGQTRSFLVLRGMGLLFTFLLGIGILLTLFIVAFGGLLLDQLAYWTEHETWSGNLWQLLRFVGPFLFLFLVFTLIYVMISEKKTQILQAVPGALFATLGWLAISLGFSWYLANFDRYARLYGSIAGLIILMVWIYLCCVVVLTGGIINYVLRERFIQRKEKIKQSKKARH